MNRLALCQLDAARWLKLSYDHLVLKLGAETNFFNLPGVRERALTMKSLADAFVLRNRALTMLELATVTQNALVRRALMTFVVAGAGFAGVETVGALNDFVREALGYYPALSEDDLRVVLVHPGAVVLPELGESLGRYAQAKLAARKVETRLEYVRQRPELAARATPIVSPEQTQARLLPGGDGRL